MSGIIPTGTQTGDTLLDDQMDGSSSDAIHCLDRVASAKMGSASPVKKLADHIERTGLEIPILPDEYRYASLPICVVDAVFSIGVRYISTQRVVKNFCGSVGWTRFAASRSDRGKGEHTLRDLIDIFAELGV